VWNEIDPSGMTFCGGDPVNSVDSDGRLAANGPDNSVQNLNFGTMAVMKTYLQTTTYFNDGSALITGYYSQNPSLYDPSQVAGWSYTTIRTDTGLSQFVVSESPLPSDYSQITWTPITTWDVEQQQETEGAKIMLTGVAMLATGTEEFAPEILGADTTVSQGVYFFGDDVLPYIDRPDATLGRSGQATFFSPLDDVSSVSSTSDAARLSGQAPSITRAYTTGGNGYGIVFPTEGLNVSLPTSADAMGNANFLNGGHTAVGLGADGPNGFLLNSTREFVTPGGGPMPPGSVLFQIGPNGSWIPIRRF
jgi:hypothetical protein